MEYTSIMQSVRIITDFNSGQFDLSKGLALTYPDIVDRDLLSIALNKIMNQPINDSNMASLNGKLAVIIEANPLVINRRDVIIDGIRPNIGMILNIDRPLLDGERTVIMGVSLSLERNTSTVTTGKMTINGFVDRLTKRLNDTD